MRMRASLGVRWVHSSPRHGIHLRQPENACHSLSHFLVHFQELDHCGILDENGPSYAHIFVCLVPSEWNCLGWIRRCGLVGGGVSLEVGFEVFQSLTLRLLPVDQDVKLSAATPAPCLSTPTMMIMKEPLRNCKQAPVKCFVP